MISFFLVSIILANQVNAQKTRKKIQSRKNQLLNKYHATLNTMNNFDPDNGNIFD